MNSPTQNILHLAACFAFTLSLVASSCGKSDKTHSDAGPAHDAGPAYDAGPHDGGAADAGPQGMGGGSVVTHHNSLTRDGMYVVPAFTRVAAATVTQDTSFTSPTIDGPTYAHPLYYDAGPGGQDLVIVATEHNTVWALDAATGSMVWMRALGSAVPLSRLPCGNIDPLGITGTPYLDTATHTLYFDAMMLSGGAPKHFIYAISIMDGSTLDGWPIDVNATATFNGVHFDSQYQNERGALTLVNGVLYVPYGGHYGDCGTYYGWVVGVTTTGTPTVSAWATRAAGAGAWSPGGTSSDGTSIFVTTGNGFGARGWQDQEAIIRLSAGPVYSQDAMDYYSPANYAMLDSGDVDLGGCGPLLLHVDGASPADLAMALGKDGYAYIADRANLGGIGGSVDSLHASTGQIISAGAAYPTADGVNVSFHANGRMCPGRAGDLTTVHVSAETPPHLSMAWCGNLSGQGAPIVTTTDGHSESVVWALASEASNELLAFNGDTGDVIFPGDGTGVDTFKRFVSPIVAKGRIFVAGAHGVFAFRVGP